MKFTRILPRKLAIRWQEYDLRRTDDYRAYYEELSQIYRQASEDGHAELERLKEGRWFPWVK